MAHRRKIVIANWKMHGRITSGVQLATDLAQKAAAHKPEGYDVVVCPPYSLLWPVAEVLAGSHIKLGAQDCHTANHGAYTGDISAGMLVDIGCQYVILGHSERRNGHGETSQFVAEKVAAAQQAGLTAIVCVGEDRPTRESGGAVEFVTKQLKESLPSRYQTSSLIVAYEPVWAIGSGTTPAENEIQEMHGAIRKALGATGEVVQVIYGGSITPHTSAGIMALSQVDGTLVGGASLNADGFWAIADRCR
ncbi:MAG: triose-phosphate isomerase [Alphaproteobacteria bacterium]|nr:triose-phosphate isomerase [Alphaproteobacteria bacterium]